MFFSNLKDVEQVNTYQVEEYPVFKYRLFKHPRQVKHHAFRLVSLVVYKFTVYFILTHLRLFCQICVKQMHIEHNRSISPLSECGCITKVMYCSHELLKVKIVFELNSLTHS